MKKGTIHVLKEFYMPQLDRSRTIRIYLPPEYDKSDASYPVIYMNDAQNLFTIENLNFHSQNILSIFPNPFFNKTHIRLSTSKTNECVSIGIFDISGRLIKNWSLLSNQEVIWDGSDNQGRKLPGGVYFCVVKQALNAKPQFKKVIYLK